MTLSHTLNAISFGAILAAFTPGAAATAQTLAASLIDSARVEIEGAMQHQDASRLAAADLLLERTLAAFPDDAYVLHYRGFVAYRRAHVIMSRDPAAARVLLHRAFSELERSATKLDWPETPALQATVIGLLITLDPSQGMDLGPRSAELLSQAEAKGPNNPRVVLLLAYAARNTPPEYGGSVERAKVLALRARDLLVSEKPDPLFPSWGKWECELLIKELGGVP